MGFVPLELALAIGFAAPIIGFIGKDVSLDTLLVHLYNDSTKGKTTALMLALSTFGCPDPKTKFSLANTWMATENYLVSMLNGNHGLPFGLDEASMFGNNMNFTSLVYRLASNKDKGRLNEDSTLKETGEWGTVIISTGEFSLLSKCYKNRGLAMRVLELGNITWTPDAKTSETIKTTVLNNYGHAGLLFAKHLLVLGKEPVISMWEEWREKVKDAMPDADKNVFADRTSSKLAAIMVAAEIAGKRFNFKFNMQEILNMLVASGDDGEETQDLGTEAYEYFLQQFNKHIRNFGIPATIKYQNGNFSVNYDVWGNTYTNPDKTEMEIRVIKSEFEKILKEGGLQDPKIILKSWKEKNLLNYEKGRNTRKVKLESNGPVTLVYCIKVNLKEGNYEFPSDENPRVESP